MKKRVFYAILAMGMFTLSMVSCKAENAAETNTLYEINAIDKDEFMEPDDRQS